MRSKLVRTCLTFGAALVMTGCSYGHNVRVPDTNFKGAEEEHYWQRIETHSAMYLTGIKAQQQLEQDISGCVREVDELIKLGAVREATPPAMEGDGYVPKEVAHWDTPTHGGALRIDHTDYHDFESCMRSEGWERVKFVPYDVSKDAQLNKRQTQRFRAGLPLDDRTYRDAMRIEDYDALRN